MKILITGARGFVGKNLTENLKNIQSGKNRTRPDLKIDEIYLIRLNGDYVNQGKLEPEKLFLCENMYGRRRIKDIVEEVDVDYEAYIEKMNSFDPEAYPPKKTRYCKLNGICQYYKQCFPNEEEEADDSILTLASSQYKNRMYESGVRHLKDVDPSLLEGNRVQYAQVMASRNGGVFIDRFGKDITFHRIDENRSELSVDVNVSPQFFGWIFSLGPDVQVVGPEEVVEEMKKEAKAFLKNLE